MGEPLPPLLLRPSRAGNPNVMRRWQCSGDLVIVIRHALRAAAGREGDRVSGGLSISLPETAELAKADGQPRTRDGVRVSFPHRGMVGKPRQRGRSQHVKLPPPHSRRILQPVKIKQTAATNDAGDTEYVGLHNITLIVGAEGYIVQTKRQQRFSFAHTNPFTCLATVYL